MRFSAPLVLILCLAAAAPAAAAAEEDGRGSFPPGQVAERVLCREDPDHSYALYLPAAYDEEKAWPVLILMDPRGRALHALELVRDAAERSGYVVLSSYDTRSDSGREPNAAALTALLPEAEARFAIDTDRVYLAGFSGTARAGWDFGFALSGHMAGLLGFGAGLPPGMEPRQDTPFVFFGGAGFTDFNYQEVRDLDGGLDRAGVPHRVRFYEGGHAWPPPPVWVEALEWLELQAMRAGLRPLSRPLVESIHERWSEEARALDAAGDHLEALRRYRGIVRDFQGLRRDVAAEIRARELAEDRAVQKAARRARKLAEEEKSYQVKFHTYLVEKLGGQEAPPAHSRSLAELGIRELRRKADGSGSPESLAARRMLETVFVYASFYQPRLLLSAGHAGTALATLAIADAVKPDHPRVCYNRARAHARLGRKQEAIDDLSCAAAAGWAVSDMVDGDPDLEPLRAEAAFQRLVGTAEDR